MSTDYRRVGTVMLALSVVLLAGCAESAAPDLGPPPDWQGADGRWWKAGVDTARAFRDLETLQRMGVADDEQTFIAGGVTRTMARERLARLTKRSLIEIYRNEPEVVDSIFTRYVRPKLDAADLGGDLSEQVRTFKERGYSLIRNHFREPLTRLRLGEDVRVAYPDSLRDVSGSVVVQVFIDAEGVPQAVELLESVHPVLDAGAMRAATEMRWQPAFVRRTGGWREVPAWVRYRIGFHSPGG